MLTLKLVVSQFVCDEFKVVSCHGPDLPWSTLQDELGLQRLVNQTKQ